MIPYKAFLFGRRLILFLFCAVMLVACANDKVNSSASNVSSVYDASNTSNVRIFPLHNYSQDADFWLNPSAASYTKNLLDAKYQAKRFMQLKHNYYGTDANSHSPWSATYISSVLKNDNYIKALQEERFAEYDNESIEDSDVAANSRKQIGHSNVLANSVEQIDQSRFYGINFQSYNKAWFNKLYQNLNIEQFKHLSYNVGNRGIVVTNLAMRSLPTSDPFFHDYRIAGEGYPFDNLQQTTAYAGTPAYVLGYTLDKAWSLILTSDYIGWVDSSGVAMADTKFVTKWQEKAYTSLVGISKSNIGIQNQYGQYVFSGFVGMLFPQNKLKSNKLEILIPEKLANGGAQIAVTSIARDSAVVLPLPASTENFATIIKALQGRPYGWGGYSLYNDCSAEMKALFVMFGIALPRNTRYQAETGVITDLSGMNETDRLNTVMQKAKPLLTLIYIKGHILLYVGNYKGSNGKEFPLSYQNMWGLKPRDQSYRLVVGKSVFFPLLPTYPEDGNVVSHAGWGTFVLVDLSSFPVTSYIVRK